MTNFLDSLLRNDHLKIEGWLRVCEHAVQRRPRAADDARAPPLPWHDGFCVLRTDERSLICYTNEEIAHCVGAQMPRLRLDGRSVRLNCPATYERVATMPRHSVPLGYGTMPRRRRVMSMLAEDDELFTPAAYSTTGVPRSETSYELIGGAGTTESLDRRGWYCSRRSPMPATAYGGPHIALLDSPTTPQRLANFLSRPFRYNPLKRTKSVSKLDRRRSPFDADGPSRSPLAPLNVGGGGGGGVESSARAAAMRGCRSQESLYATTTTHMIDLADGGFAAPVHASVLGAPNCFRLSTRAGATKYYAARTPVERDRWTESIRRTMYPNRDGQGRVENSLQLWLLEAKGVQSKRRYFCDVCLDRTLYARTSAKPKTDICFWGEQFDFGNLPQLESVCVNLYREADRKKRKDRDTLVGFVRIPIDQLTVRHPLERWYTVTGADKPSTSKDLPAIRIKARYQSVHILPLRAYDGLMQYIRSNYLDLCLALEPSVAVKAKEDFATSIVRVLQTQHCAKEFLCDLIMAEVQALDNEHLMFRGNSLATKAMEAYMKLVAENYLQDTLGDYIRQVLDSQDDCEVDPLRLPNLAMLEAHRNLLTYHVETAWGKIINSSRSFPLELRQVFQALRQRLALAGRAELADNLISSSIFLRFLCPAILSPSLFGLVAEYPVGAAARNLTLIAKSLQTLANFSRFGGKESYMEFMNEFVEHGWVNMRDFLKQISSLSAPGQRLQFPWDGAIDVGKDLSLLTNYLSENWPNLPPESQEQLSGLAPILDYLNESARDPSLLVVKSQASPESSLSPATSANSDYENEQPGVTRAAASSTSAAATLHTADDYATASAVAENVALRRTGYAVRPRVDETAERAQSQVQQSRKKTTPTSRALTAREVISGRASDAMAYVDEATPSSARSRRPSTPDRFSADDGSSGELEVKAHLLHHATSSGYQSLNHSSPESSSSSSPVERQANPPLPNATDAAVPLPSAPLTPSVKPTSALPLSIANPLYSLHQIPPPPLSKQRQACQSLPDIQAVDQTALSQLPRRTPRMAELDVNAHRRLTPDSSFEEPAQMSASELWNPVASAQAARNSVGTLSTSLTPQALRDMLLQTDADATSTPTSPPEPARVSLASSAPRTNPRCPAPSTRSSVRSNASIASSGSSGAGSTPYRLDMVSLQDRLRANSESWRTRSQYQARPSTAATPTATGASIQQTPVTRVEWRDQVKPIICRLQTVEHELEEEQTSSQRKQHIIDSQRRKIENLMEANQKLMDSLCRLRDEQRARLLGGGGSPAQSADSLLSPRRPPRTPAASLAIGGGGGGGALLNPFLTPPMSDSAAHPRARSAGALSQESFESADSEPPMPKSTTC